MQLGLWDAHVTTVTLSDEWIEEAQAHAERQVKYAIQKGLHPRWGYTPDLALRQSVQGAAAEIAAGLLTGLPWNPFIGVRKSLADLGSIVEVRSTPVLNGSLPFKRNDLSDRIYMLMVGSLPTFDCPGWLWGDELAQCPLRMDWQHPARAASQDMLHPLPLPGRAYR